jgi:hypothetical protein
MAPQTRAARHSMATRSASRPGCDRRVNCALATNGSIARWFALEKARPALPVSAECSALINAAIAVANRLAALLFLAPSVACVTARIDLASEATFRNNRPILIRSRLPSVRLWELALGILLSMCDPASRPRLCFANETCSGSCRRRPATAARLLSRTTPAIRSKAPHARADSDPLSVLGCLDIQ